jgi:ferredoxin/flavodoxin---NADP+ reductase
MATESKVISRKLLSPTLFIVRFERKKFQFIPGQYINVGVADDSNFREYSIYSGANDDFLEILVRTVPDGYLSPKLADLNAGDPIFYTGPHGEFTLNNTASGSHYCLIATGSGISPFHSMLRSRPQISHTILHGTSTTADLINPIDESQYLSCVSRQKGGFFNGRVTACLGKNFIKADYYYLCGNSDMIYSVFSILEANGTPRDRVKTEVYF